MMEGWDVDRGYVRSWDLDMEAIEQLPNPLLPTQNQHD